MPLKVKVDSLARNTESLFKLLGGNQDDRLRFWEILKGITTPAVQRLVEAQIDATAAQVHSVQAVVNALHVNAKELGKTH
jgi:hypothetical protein